MSCYSYRLINNTSSPITQNFTGCTGNACSVTVLSGDTLPSGATKYFITADSTTFVPNPAFYSVTTYSANTRSVFI